MLDTIDDDEVDDLRRQRAHDMRHRSALARAPACNDPDHPGCGLCWEDDNEEDEDD